MRDFHGVSIDMETGGPPVPVACSGDGSEMNQHGFKHFRRKASRRGAGSLVPEAGLHEDVSETDLPRNLPARIEDEWDLLQRVAPGFRDPGTENAALVSLHRADPAARSFDLLRTRLLQALRDHGWKRVAVASPVRGCGTTFTAVNLALSTARIPGSRTILFDLNLRDPGVAKALGIHGAGDMRQFLNGEIPARQHVVRVCETLGIGLADRPERDASECLHDPRTARSLDRMMTSLRPETVFFDLPPLLEHDDASAFLPQVDGVLLVADGTRTTAADIRACERILDGQTRLLGVVLNRARH